MKKRKYWLCTTHIMGQEWNVYILRDAEFKEHTGYNASGVTFGTMREIALNIDHMDQYTIAHELGHAYVAECCADHGDISRDAIEEIMTEMYARHGKTLLKQAAAIAAALREKLKYSAKR